jgi:spore coat polysaccharide biosynthesis protein SpsF (cytidylyltransferase family)
MRSTRLPQKAILKIKGRTVIEHLIDRLKTAKLPDMIILCTSTHPDDEILVEIAKKNHIEYFRGSESDKLERFLRAAEKYNLDFIVCVDGDDIFCDPEYIDRTIETFIRTQADYITCKELPLGAASHGIKVEALRKICMMKDEVDTEIYGGYFTQTGLFKVEFLKVEDETLRHPEIRMTLDYQEDYEFFKAIFDELYKPGYVFTLKEIMTLLKNKPHIIDINKSVQERYAERIRKQTKLKLKS